MQETIKAARRNKVLLEDYDYKADIACRILLSTFDKNDHQILEEILYSPIQFTLEKLASNLDISPNIALATIHKLVPSNLFKFDGEILTINKDKRKYFEIHIEKFEDDFSPGMDFLQNLLKCVPIDVLPIWYLIPRSSNNIFESIVEKYLHTPAVFQRYLIEFKTTEDILVQIVEDLYGSKDLQIPLSELMTKYDLSHEQMTELCIYLEFSLVGVTSYIPDGDHWIEVLTPFSEWVSYQKFLDARIPNPIESSSEIQLQRKLEYAFVEDMKEILKLSTEADIQIGFNPKADQWSVLQESHEVVDAHLVLDGTPFEYVNRLVNKLLILGLAVIEERSLKPAPPAADWIDTIVEKRAHITFKHPHNFIAMQKSFPMTTQRAIMEIEKSLHMISKVEWVYFDDFINGSQIALNEEQKITLRPVGRTWQYAIPSYTLEESVFIEAITLDWLFEAGVVQVGFHQDKRCFKLTSLGLTLFS